MFNKAPDILQVRSVSRCERCTSKPKPEFPLLLKVLALQPSSSTTHSGYALTEFCYGGGGGGGLLKSWSHSVDSCIIGLTHRGSMIFAAIYVKSRIL